MNSEFPNTDSPPEEAISQLAALLRVAPTGCRGALLQAAVAFRPSASWTTGFTVGLVRAAFAACWKSRFRGPVPVESLREILTGPISIRTMIHLGRLNVVEDDTEIQQAIGQLIDHLRECVRDWKPPNSPRAPPFPPAR